MKDKTHCLSPFHLPPPWPQQTHDCTADKHAPGAFHFEFPL